MFHGRLNYGLKGLFLLWGHGRKHQTGVCALHMHPPHKDTFAAGKQREWGLAFSCFLFPSSLLAWFLMGMIGMA
jgi:hypothetical protein